MVLFGFHKNSLFRGGSKKNIMIEATISIYNIWSFPVNDGCAHYHPDNGVPGKKCNVGEKFERGI